MDNLSKFSRVWEVTRLFFKLGLTAFGGPAAHIALMEREVVEKRQWMTPDAFLDLVGATQLIPGPNSTEMAMHCGYHRAGKTGLFAAGTSFIFPAFSLTLALAYLYVKSGSLPQINALLFGIKPAMVVVIAMAVAKLGKKALNTRPNMAVGMVVFFLAAQGHSEILAILVGGLLGIIAKVMLAPSKKLFSVGLPTLTLFTLWGKIDLSEKLMPLFLECLKIGAVLYGSGYVLIAYVENTFVNQLGWLTPGRLLDAIAIGQLTPGPVLTTATVIGYFISGFPGAVLATAGIFLPSFFFVLILNPFIPKLRQSRLASGFLDGVNAGALALMGYVTLILAKQILDGWESLAILGFAILWHRIPRLKSNAIGLVVLSALFGYILLLF